MNRAAGCGIERRQTGAAIIEFGVVAATFLLLLLAVMEFGAMLWVNLTMQHAVREGARYAITGQSNLDPNPLRPQRYSAVIEDIKANSMGLYAAVKPVIQVSVNGGSPMMYGDPTLYNAGMFGGPGDLVVLQLDCAWPSASLASRSLLPAGESLPYQQIMASLVATAPPLDMTEDGTIYVTKIQGHLDMGVVRNVVVEQYRWARGWHRSAYSPPSAVWTCGSAGTSWETGGANDGSCGGLPSAGPASPVAGVMTGQLADGEVIYAVEGFYRFNMLFGSLNFGYGKLPEIGPTLESIAIF